MKQINNQFINDITNIIYKHINEMARLSIQRTIDKKLWATVSSICSRNKSTEAEFIKPIGSDINNLLQRYVAALIIMKKPCPISIDDINKLKTFKLVGNKYIDLGGTLQEIQELYNKNTASNNTVTVQKTNSNITKAEQSNNIKDTTTDNEHPEETDDSWESLFDKYEDDSDDTSFLSGFEEDITDSSEDTLSSIILPLPYDADIKDIFLAVSKLTNITGFKEFNKNNKDAYTYLKYIAQSTRATQGKKIYQSLKNKWDLYINTGLSNFFGTTPDNYSYSYGPRSNWSMLPIDFTYNDTISNIEKIYKGIYPKEKYDINLLKNFRQEYKDFVDSLPTDVLKNVVKISSLYEYILVSPDNGLIFTKRYDMSDDIIYCNNASSYTEVYRILDRNSEKYTFSKIDNINGIYSGKSCRYNIIYEIHFTGEVNYYNELSDTTAINKRKDNIARLKKLKKLNTILKEYVKAHINQSDSYVTLNAEYISFDVNNNPMYKNMVENKNIHNFDRATWWVGHGGCTKVGQRPNRKTGLIKSLSLKYPGYTKYTTDTATNYNYVNACIHQGWKVTGQISDADECVTLTTYINAQDHELACINLTPKGATQFRKLINVDDFI